MPQPLFGLSGSDSISNAARIDVLELVEGITMRQFVRMNRPFKTEQRTTVTAWGITAPVSDKYWAESVSLSVQEEAVQHEVWNTVVPALDSDGSVAFDANLVFRARATFSVSGKCVEIDDPGAEDWPDTYDSAIGAYSVGMGLYPGTDPVLSSADYTQIGVNWHTFSYEYQWIIPGDESGVNLLDFTDFNLAPVAGYYHMLNKSYTLQFEGFATRSMSADFYPQL